MGRVHWFNEITSLKSVRLIGTRIFISNERKTYELCHNK